MRAERENIEPIQVLLAVEACRLLFYGTGGFHKNEKHVWSLKGEVQSPQHFQY